MRAQLRPAVRCGWFVGLVRGWYRDLREEQAGPMMITSANSR
jgi:hypothetical protein